ncbi:MAG TPA: peptidylprolyl isomerase [Ferruginibacter sp.]|nr:peptidylprolyl isomerase [Ferruginibacter sp.]
MKKFYVFIAMAISSPAVFSQALITYGNNSISREEFMKAYNKNKTPVTDKEKSLREYAELYSNFKLKVKAARDLRIDTLQQLNYDVENFRQQVIENYLSDEKGLDRLMDEAFARSARDIRVMHYSIPVVENAKPEDTLIAKQAINELYATLKNGSANIPADILSKYSGLRQSDIGYITVFSVPYEYENIIYSLKPGEISTPYRSKNAWHLFRVSGERKSVGKWRVAQILLVFPPDANEATKLSIQKKADSIYQLLKKGADFAEMAETYSDDKLTAQSKGELPEFGTGKFTNDFEEQVFTLKEDGEISRPFATTFGYHIVKRLGQTPVSVDKADAGSRFELKQKILQDSRINIEKEKFSKSILPLIEYKRTGVTNAELSRYADSVMKYTPDKVHTFPISNKTIITYKKENLKGSDWLRFVREYKANPQYKGENNDQLWEKFVTLSALDYYKKHLEEYNPEFKFQMEEFKEGNMLFEIMERNVWNKAIVDTNGLLKHYNNNKADYKWAASADVLIFNAANEAAGNHALADLTAGKNWKAIADEHNDVLQADSGRYELSQLITGEKVINPQPGNISPLIKNQDGSAAFVKYLRIYEPGLQRNFEDARGLVINDYQNVLEKNWLASLKKKYPVKLNETVFKQLLK